MFFLRPGIGKINVHGFEGSGGEKVLEDVARFDAEEAQVGEVGASAFFVELANAAEQALDAEEIFF